MRRGLNHPEPRRRVSRSRGSMVLMAVVTTLVIVSSCTPVPPPSMEITWPEVPYRVIAGIEQIYVLGAQPGNEIAVSSEGTPTQRGVADRLGSLAIRGLEQGREYQVTDETSGNTQSAKVLVATDNPPQSFYDKTSMHEGLNYIPMRDGITLAAAVRPPIGASLADGPFPTLIEYSGYQIAAPDEPLVAKVGSLLGLPPDPLAPGSETDVGSLLMRLAGFAVVSVQGRGSGCSGGESDLFDRPTRYDGYDAVETVAAQPWVSNGRVGMTGISFSGFAQIAVAATHPPHLAAIAPLSFLGSLYDVARPGGILNNGFAQGWLAERQESARPAPDPGALPYANYLVHTDPQCRYNQRLRLQTRDGVGLVESNRYFSDQYRRRDFRVWMGQTEVPTFASLQFNDEETGPYAILSSQRLLDANPRVWLNLSNGHHRDSVTPDTIMELMEFLDIYVGRRPPQLKPLIYLLSSVIFGDGSVTPPLPDIFAWNVANAQRQFEAKPRVRIMLGLTDGMNEGHNTGERWKFGADEFPMAGSTDRTFYLGSNGALSDESGGASAVSYNSDPAARPATTSVPEDAPDDVPTEIVWSPVPEGDGLGFVTEPLTEDVVALGPVGARISLTSSADDTDIGLAISEVRPAGREMLVGMGVQRASMRATDAALSTSTEPHFTLERSDYLDGSEVIVPVQIPPIGHVFRAGSRIRFSIHAVGGDSEKWAFESVDPSGGSTINTVHLGGFNPSSFTMTVARATGYPRLLDACPSAGMPCRPYRPADNGG